MVLFLFVFHIIAVMISRLVFNSPFLPDHGPEQEPGPVHVEGEYDDVGVDDERELHVCNEEDEDDDC